MKRNWRKWGEHEIATVREMRDQGFSIRQISDEIGRSYDAVKTALRNPDASCPACLTQEQYNDNAYIGSRNLLAAIVRAMAA